MDKKTLGIVSGGQLGRMLTEPAIKLGFDVVVLDPTPNCPAAQVGAKQIVGSWKDAALLKQVAESSDYFTIEIEHIDTKSLEELTDKNINPAPKTIELIQNKYNQKIFLNDNDLKTAEFVEITDEEQARKVLTDFGGKMILKSKTDAYDGRGNEIVDSPESLAKALERFAGFGLYAEKLVNFKKELAVMVAKDMSGNMQAFPTAETFHERNICIEVRAPAEINENLQKTAQEIAKKVVSKLEGAGVYGVEMFLDQNDEILINEIAPRVHNSGHYTMDACNVSQFEQHVRAVTGMELLEVKMTSSAAAMVNILGERDGPVELKGVEEAEKIPGVSVYLYGKTPTKIDRKMGHINAVAGTIEESIENARKARRLISI